jgi:hypothetical protein
MENREERPCDKRVHTSGWNTGRIRKKFRVLGANVLYVQRISAVEKKKGEGGTNRGRRSFK